MLRYPHAAGRYRGHVGDRVACDHAHQGVERDRDGDVKRGYYYSIAIELISPGAKTPVK